MEGRLKMRLVLVNEVLSPRDAGVFFRGIQATLVDAQKEYGVLFESITVENWLDPKVPYVPTNQDCVIYISERNRHPKAAGYHDTDKVHNVPYAYISPQAAGSVFGKIHHPLVQLAHKVGSLLIPTRSFGKFQMLAQGAFLATVHEILEILGDPWIKAISGVMPGTTQDSQGRGWLMEICDPVDKCFVLWTDPVTGQDCVNTDWVLKNFYNKDWVGAVTHNRSIATPFTLGKGGYAFWDNKGVFTKV